MYKVIGFSFGRLGREGGVRVGGREIWGYEGFISF